MIRLILLTFFCLAQATAANARQLCFVLPLTGGQAAFGESVMRGAQLAQQKMSVCANDKSAAEPNDCALKDVKFVFEDHSGEPARAVSAVESLLRSNNCDAFAVFGSATSLAVVDRLERVGKLTISIATSDKIQTGKKFVFRNMAAATAIAKPLSEEAHRTGLKQVVSITTIHDGMFAYRDAFESAFGSPFVQKIEVAPAEADMKAYALQAKHANAGGVFITLLPPQSSMFSREIRALGYAKPLFASNQIETPDELKSAGTAFEGLWYAREGSEGSRSIDAELAKRFPDGKTIFAPNGYDTAAILGLALSAPDPRGYVENLKGFSGAQGTLSTLPDHSFDIPVRLMIVRQGRFTMK